MLKIIAEQEHHLRISDDQRFTVVEWRVGKIDPLRTGVRHGLDLDYETIAEPIHQSGSYSEQDAQCHPVEVASQWRDLFRARSMKPMAYLVELPRRALHPMSTVKGPYCLVIIGGTATRTELCLV